MSWKEDASYLKSIRPYVTLSVWMFLASAALGFIVSIRNPDLAASYVGDVAEKLQWILDLSPPKMMMAIFLNNLFASTVALLLGVGFGIVPAVVVVVNGLVVGLVVHQAMLAGGLGFGVGELGRCRLQLGEDVVGGTKQQLSLLRQHEAAGVTMEQRDLEILLQRADLPADRRLAHIELVAGMREGAGFRGRVEDAELVPIHT